MSSNPPVDFDEPFPPKKVAQLLDTSVDRLANDRHLRRGIPYVKHGSRVFYLRSDVTAYLAAHRVVPEQERLSVTDIKPATRRSDSPSPRSSALNR